MSAHEGRDIEPARAGRTPGAQRRDAMATAQDPGGRDPGDQRTPAPASPGGLPEGWGNRGRKPCKSDPEDVAGATVILASGKYSGFSHSRLTEVLAEREGIHLSRQTLSRLLNRHGLTSARQHRPPKHRVRRERMPQEGMLCRSTAAITLGWSTEGPDSYCCWRRTTPPARWPTPYSGPRRTPGAPSC